LAIGLKSLGEARDEETEKQEDGEYDFHDFSGGGVPSPASRARIIFVDVGPGALAPGCMLSSATRTQEILFDRDSKAASRTQKSFWARSQKLTVPVRSLIPLQLCLPVSRSRGRN